ncbi:MAG TPA: DotU family type IV/VI secretion system protein, partial [Burkholderiaceae bacterium]|nr:DotU family type IV/VI secretion system protein [Burkholderiaceae bacterium]
MTSKRNGEYGEGMLRGRRAAAGVDGAAPATPTAGKGVAGASTPPAGKDVAGAATPLAAKGAAGVELQRLVAGINPLLGAANVLLALIPQLRATTSHADPAGLQRHLLERVKEFEAGARAGGVARPKIVAARYLLCTFI